MLLILKTLDSHGKVCSSTCSVASIEDSANFLESLLNQHHTLLLAHVWKNRKRTSLSLGPFTGSIPTLLQHWQVRLSVAPPDVVLPNHIELLIDLTRRQVNQQLFGIANHERMISYYNHCIQQVQNDPASPRRADYTSQQYAYNDYQASTTSK